MPPPKRRHRWEPTPADLPTEKAQAAEPRLRDLENNAIFRLMTFYQSGEVSLWGPIVWISFLLLAGALVTLIGGSLVHFVALLSVACVGFMIPLCFSGRLGSVVVTINRPFPLSLYRELAQTTFKPDEFINTLWGSQSRRRAMRRRVTAFYGLTLITLMVISVYGWLEWGMRWVCTLALFVLGSLLGGVRFDPYHVLSSVHEEIKNQRHMIDRMRIPFWALRVLVKPIIGLLVVLALLVFVAVKLMLLSPAISVVFKKYEWLLEYTWVFATHLAGLSVLAIGWLLGRVFAIIDQARTPKRLKRMRDDINRIIELQLTDQVMRDRWPAS